MEAGRQHTRGQPSRPPGAVGGVAAEYDHTAELLEDGRGVVEEPGEPLEEQEPKERLQQLLEGFSTKDVGLPLLLYESPVLEEVLDSVFTTLHRDCHFTGPRVTRDLTVEGTVF